MNYFISIDSNYSKVPSVILIQYIFSQNQQISPHNPVHSKGHRQTQTINYLAL